jgi:uracil phosphoribosyltransferase
MADIQHRSVRYKLSEVEHRYGQNVHILSDPIALTHLARICAKGTYQPMIFRLVGLLYQQLLEAVINCELPRATHTIPSRMIDYTPRGVYEGEIVSPDTRVVCVDIARAGTFPSHTCYDFLNCLLNPENVRQDHLQMNRTTDDTQKVTGAAIQGSKIGGPIHDRYILLPDPMGATGSSLARAITLYKDRVEGPAKRYITMHLIVTPEYLQRMREEHPDVIVYAVRLDRGLSSPEVLATVPGERWAEERGLNEHQYIVPGGGGFGEVMNNCLV